MSRQSKGVVVSNSNGHARARWTYGGVRRSIGLGPVTDPGAVQRALARLHARLAADPGYAPGGDVQDYLVAELVRDYLAGADPSVRHRQTLKSLTAGYARGTLDAKRSAEAAALPSIA